MSSSIALGCNGYEAHMQQILTLYGVYVVAGDHDFCLQKPPESSKTERETQNYLGFISVFGKCLAVSEEIIGIQQALISSQRYSEKTGNSMFSGFLHVQNFIKGGL